MYVARLTYIALPMSVHVDSIMEADSSSNCDNFFLHTSESCETLADPTDLFCCNCRVPEFDQSRLQTLITTVKPGNLFFVLSTCYLLCERCRSFMHLHCYLNSEDISTEDLTSLIERLPYICQNCSDGQPEQQL